MNIRKIFIECAIALLPLGTFAQTTDQKVDALLAKMTLEEKVGQMNQYTGFWEVTGPAPQGGDAANKYNQLKAGQIGSMLNVTGVKEVRALQKIAVEQTRLGIPVIIGYDVIHGFKTLSPIPLAEAASFDLEAIEKSAAAAAKETAAAGINWVFAPMVDISRDARWGRVMEGAGEDPYYGALVAAARVKGLQGNLSENNVAACAKHYAGYGFAEGGRDYNLVEVSHSTLYNTILPPFKAAADAGVLTFMNSFNTLNGVPATASKFLQRDILKGEWGFKGFVDSDWASIRELIYHGYAANEEEAGIMALSAGSDMDLEGGIYIKTLVKLVQEGKVSESLIDDAVRRILRVKYELGLFDNPYKFLDENREKAVTGSKEIHDAVLDMAKKSIVLLKNEENLLPLKKSGQKIALIGELAGDKNSPLGSWRAMAAPNSAVSVLEGMQKYANPVTYVKGTNVFKGRLSFGWDVEVNPGDKSGFKEAINAAKTADVVVMVLGEYAFQTGEGASRANLDLPGNQQELLKEVLKVNKNVVLVLNNGRPLAIPFEAENVPAIVEAWHLGTEAGNAVAQVLYGDYNPSGKLPVTFPRSAAQLPLYYNTLTTARGDEIDQVFWSHYSDLPKTPVYPFGYGLSYTTFEYKNLTLNKTSFAQGDPVKVNITITNTGNYDGKEVAQLYLHDLAGSLARPAKELKGFQLVELKRGESKTLEFTLTDKELGFWDNDGRFAVEAGKFEVFVGTNSGDDKLKTSFEVK